MTYTDLCQPCYVNYDMILKLETNDLDKQYFLEELSRENHNVRAGNLSDIAVLNPTNRKPPSPVKSLPELKGISPEVLYNLYNVYQQDFEMFGYIYDNLTGLCKDENNKGCC